jgi:hypothetical protein
VIYDANRRPPVVTDVDRAWAMTQKPQTWDEDAPDLDFADVVEEQARAFERELGHLRVRPDEWSARWRYQWWPAADPAIRHPDTAPHVPHPFIRADHPAWPRVLATLSRDERQIAERFGVMTMRPDDPRVAGLGDVFTLIEKRPRRRAA